MDSLADDPRLNLRSWHDVIVEDTKKLVRLETWRNQENEHAVVKNLLKIKQHFDEKMRAFNKQWGENIITAFEWKTQKAEAGEYWVFGYRAGSGRRKVSLICHLDTVPPGNDDWRPFEPREETRIYNGAPTPFLIGRGAIDDKGPAVVAFEAFVRALGEAQGDPSAVEDALENVTLEVLFDTSEETDMSTPHYFADHPEAKPELGIVFDAYWSVRAEKGVERPVFSVRSDAVSAAPDQDAALLAVALSTPPGPVNMIPVTAEARIQGPAGKLKDFADNVRAWYRAHAFDDPNYHAADIRVSRTDGEVVITTLVAGAQHGSAPHQNRANGANPLVSLANFIAFLVDRGILGNNVNGEMSRFIRWAFGTRVFGENHPDLLYRFDPVFREGNGTTYALTQLYTVQDGLIQRANLGIDVRYAVGHHGKGWDGTEGKIEGKSAFESVFNQLVQRYKAEAGGAEITVAFGKPHDEGFGPDVRSLRNDRLFRVDMAYRSIMGENCPMHATGGGTDAHAIPNWSPRDRSSPPTWAPPSTTTGWTRARRSPTWRTAARSCSICCSRSLPCRSPS